MTPILASKAGSFLVLPLRRVIVTHWVLVNPFQPIFVRQDGQTTRDRNEAARFASKEDAEVFSNDHGARYFVTREYHEFPPPTD